MVRAALHTIVAVVALAATLRFAYNGPMWLQMAVYTLAWMVCALVYFGAVYGWETAVDSMEARIRKNLHDERIRDEMTRYRRRLRVVRRIHRARPATDSAPDERREA
jgi:hypothetical protein